jgi:hypothetical protein
MEYNPLKINYKIIANNTVVGTGEIYSMFCNGLTEMFVDHDPVKYSIEFEYNGKVILVNSPYIKTSG